MKVIDLLNKIANGEETPKKIMYENISYYWCEPCKIYERDEDTTRDLYNDIDNLNDEIEIIEEPKKIEKIKTKLFANDGIFINDNVINVKKINAVEAHIIRKLNEIIDYINRGEE